MLDARHRVADDPGDVLGHDRLTKLHEPRRRHGQEENANERRHEALDHAHVWIGRPLVHGSRNLTFRKRVEKGPYVCVIDTSDWITANREHTSIVRNRGSPIAL